MTDEQGVPLSTVVTVLLTKASKCDPAPHLVAGAKMVKDLQARFDRAVAKRPSREQAQADARERESTRLP